MLTAASQLPPPLSDPPGHDYLNLWPPPPRLATPPPSAAPALLGGERLPAGLGGGGGQKCMYKAHANNFLIPSKLGCPHGPNW